MIWGQHRIKPTKQSKVCPSWIVLDFDGQKIEVAHMFTDAVEWWPTARAYCKEKGDLWAWIASLQLPKETWVIGWNMYQALCWSGLYESLNSGSVYLPTKQNKDGVKTLSGSLSCYKDVTIIDLATKGKKLHCIDLANYEITREAMAALHDNGIDQALHAVKDYVELTQQYGMGTFQNTAAAQGWFGYRRQHLTHSIYVHKIPHVRALERAAYVGGRCEVYKMGRTEGPIWYLDIRSMYPSIGLKESFPTELDAYGPGLDLATLAKMLATFHVIAEVEVYTPAPVYPLKKDDDTTWPIGRFKTVLCTPELKYALEHGHIKSVGAWASYRHAKIFEKNTQWYYSMLADLDDKGLKHMSGAAKKLQVAMYGKIGARSRNWIACEQDHRKLKWGMWEIEHPVHKQITVARAVDSNYQYLDDQQEPRNCCPAISATMCSYGRMLYWSIKSLAGHENVPYGDTDAIMANEKGHQRVKEARILTGERGQLDVKGKADWIDVRGIKHYCMGGGDYPFLGEWTQAGVPKGHARGSDGDVTLMEHERIGQGLFQRRPFKDAYRQYLIPGRPKYTHGTVNSDGTVSPFEIKDGEK